VSHKLRRIYYREILFGMVQCICHDHRAYTRMYMYTQTASDSRKREIARSRNVVVVAATLSRKGKNEEEEMICTGRAAYTETKAYVCICVFNTLSRTRVAKCRRIEKSSQRDSSCELGYLIFEIGH